MPPDNDFTISVAPNLDRDRPHGHRLGGEQFHPQRIQRTYQHPQIRSLIAKHCEQLSSGLVDIFRTEVEREVKQRVSEVIISEATACCEHLRSKDEAILAAETKCKELQEQLELSDQMCRQLQERVEQLEAIEAELRDALSEGLEVQQTGAVQPPLDGRHLAVVYERRENRMLCRLCVDSRSKDGATAVISFKEDVKLSILAWHIQHQHPQDYDVLLSMAEEELSEVAKEMSRVEDRTP